MRRYGISDEKLAQFGNIGAPQWSDFHSGDHTMVPTNGVGSMVTQTFSRFVHDTSGIGWPGNSAVCTVFAHSRGACAPQSTSSPLFQLCNHIRRRLFWLRQVVSAFDNFFLEPSEASEPEPASLHSPDGEPPSSVFLRVAGLACVHCCVGIDAVSGRIVLFSEECYVGLSPTRDIC